MLIGVIGFGILSGCLGAVMALAGFGSVLLALLAYAVFGSLGAILFAVAATQRPDIEMDAETQADSTTQA